MAEAVRRTAKSTQEQAVASWINYLYQCRYDELCERLMRQDTNLENALKELSELKAFIGDPGHILGSDFTKHGEIAEHMQVNISNARNAIKGLEREYTFDKVGRTAPEDYLKAGQHIQSKFYNGINNTLFGNHGLAEHMSTYPDFVPNGGAYDIPKDQYEEMVRILDMFKKQPSQLSTSDYCLAKKIDEFLEKSGLEPGKDIKPAVIEYKQAQMSVADNTVSDEEKSIRKTDEKKRQEVYEDLKPTLKDGLKTAGISAAIEGGMAFCLSIAQKRKEKKFAEFTEDDWKEIGIDTGKGAIKGGIRGGTIYILTNFTATPANMASAYVTAAFGIATQTLALERGEVTKEDFVINCETICLDVSISAIASLAGQVLIPIPVLGAVIGNVAGEFLYEICKKQGSEYSQRKISEYNEEMQVLEQELAFKYMQVVLDIKNELKRFSDLEKMAFDEDVNRAFSGSIELARELGVDDNLILHNISQIDSYFMS